VLFWDSETRAAAQILPGFLLTAVFHIQARTRIPLKSRCISKISAKIRRVTPQNPLSHSNLAKNVAIPNLSRYSPLSNRLGTARCHGEWRQWDRKT
jgi:hypothetical protein